MWKAYEQITYNGSRPISTNHLLQEKCLSERGKRTKLKTHEIYDCLNMLGLDGAGWMDGLISQNEELLQQKNDKQ